MSGREVGWGAIDTREKRDRKERDRGKESQGRKQEKETEEREMGGEEGAHTYTQAGRQGSKQEGVKVKTITRGAGSVRLCAAPWKCQALCSLTVSCTRRPESAGSLTKTDSSN